MPTFPFIVLKFTFLKTSVLSKPNNFALSFSLFLYSFFGVACVFIALPHIVLINSVQINVIISFKLICFNLKNHRFPKKMFFPHFPSLFPCFLLNPSPSFVWKERKFSNQLIPLLERFPAKTVVLPKCMDSEKNWPK